MKLLVLPLLLLLITAYQSLRIERVFAAEKDVPTHTSPPPEWLTSLLAIDVPVAERLKEVGERKSQLERRAKMQRTFDYAAKAVYTIEAPDVVTVTLRRDALAKRKGLKPLPAESNDLLDGRNCVVQMDGTIDLGELGFVNIGGKTVDEATRIVAGQFIQFADSVSLSVHSSNSRVFYLIVEDANGASNVTRESMPYPLRPDLNVECAIEQGFHINSGLQRSQDLSKCRITLRRPANAPGTSNEYAIEWDGAKNAPAEFFNYPLVPGDQLLISLPRLAEPSGAAASQRSEASDAPTRESVLPATPVEVNAVYRLQPFDTIKLRVARPHRPAHALTWGDIEGEFTVDHRGELDLSHKLGIVTVADLSADEARAAIERQLRESIPDCAVTLTLATLAAEKNIIVIQRSDKTELATGALRPGGLSEEEFFQFRSFIAELVPIREIKLVRAGSPGSAETIKLSTVWDAIQLPLMPANEHNVRPGDRLIITVADDWRPRIYPLWLAPCDVEGKRGQMQYRFVPGWRPVYSTQFDHPDVQRPATRISF